MKRAPHLEVDVHNLLGYENVWSDDHRRLHQVIRKMSKGIATEVDEKLLDDITREMSR